MPLQSIKGGVLYLLNFWRKDDCIKLKAICKATLLSIGSSLEGKIMVQNHPWTQMSFNSVSHKTGPYGMKTYSLQSLQRFFFWWNWSYLQCDIAEVKKKLEYTLVILLLIVVFFSQQWVITLSCSEFLDTLFLSCTLLLT